MTLKLEGMQRILFPTDFSENSWNAIVYALSFFKGQAMELHLLHLGLSGSVDSSADLHVQGISVSFSDSSVQQRLMNFESRIDTNFPGHQHRIFLHFETCLFVEGIRKFVRKHDIDLIVMGTKGASGIKEVTLGSHAGAVITRVKCSTLVIPEKAHYIVPENIAFPTDFNIVYKSKVLQTLTGFASFHHSSIKVLRVARKRSGLGPEQVKNRDFLSDTLQGIPHSFHWIQSPELEHGLQEFIDSMKIDVVAMVGKNLNFFQRLLFKPTIAKIGYHTEIPFLVLHE